MRFSIIVPVYNVAPYVERCLESVVLAIQRLATQVVEAPIAEVICVDDGSTDGSGELLDKIQRRWLPQQSLIEIRVIHQSNSGVSVARNRALEQAVGDYICFVDADDEVEEDWLIAYETVLKDSTIDVVRLPGRREWLLDGYPWKYTIRREVALMARFPKGVAVTEDSLYVARLQPYVGRVVFLDRMTYRHFSRPASAMSCRLKSGERWRYLMALREIVEAQPTVDRRVFSQLGLGGLMMWLLRPQDVQYRREIRTEWLRLKSLGCADRKMVDVIYRLPYEIYARLGLIWPARLWHIGIAELLAVKRRFKRIQR